MIKLFFPLCLLLLFTCSRAMSQWYDITPSTVEFNDYLTDLEFISSDTGLVTARILDGNYHSRIYRTTDGGNTWTDVASPSTEGIIGGLCGVTDLLWYAIDGRDLIRSTDGGITWGVVSQIAPSLPPGLYDVVFPTDSVGYAVFWNPVICYKTTDAGATWSQITFPMIDMTTVVTWDGVPTKLFTFLSADTGLVCSSPNYLQRTYDGGLTWDSVYVPGVNPIFGGTSYMQFEAFDGQHAYAIMDSIHLTTDGGQSWNTIGQGLYADVFDFPHMDTAYFTSCRYIPMTTYEGWLSRIFGIANGPTQVYPNSYMRCMRELQFLDARIGFAITDNNAMAPTYRLLRTQNGAVGREDALPASDVLKVWPQPAHDELQVRLQNHRLLSEITVYTVEGTAITELQDVYEEGAKFSVALWSPGIYLIRARDVDGLEYRVRFIVQ
jgi:photosystem II stability/assembly factor-like uncharacterized protein